MKNFYHLFFKTFITIIFGCLYLFHPSVATAQLVVNDNQTAAALAADLVGGGVTIINPQLTCAGVANGIFTATNSNLGIGEGIILTSGRAKTANGQFGVNGPASDFASTANGTPGDAQLTALAGQPTNDACVLQFDFKPTGDTIRFQYVFGSEEYNGYTCSSFNDVFGFFISGPGIAGAPNIALVPGTNIPVCINSVNCGGGQQSICDALTGPGSPYCVYYVNNIGGATVSYDGFTTVLTAQAVVSPCDTYHLKLGVADASDEVLDSGVFIKGGSLSSPGVTVSETHNKCIRGCKPGQFVFNVNPPSTDTITVHYEIDGTAINGYDYAQIADSLVILPNVVDDTLFIYPLGVPPTGPKTVQLKIFAPFTCDGLPAIIDSVTMTIYDSAKVHILTSDTTVCNGDSVHVIATADSFLINFNWTPTVGVHFDTSLSPYITPPLDTVITYVLTGISDSVYGCKSEDSIVITARSINIDSIKTTLSSCNVCDGTMIIYGLVPLEQDTMTYSINGTLLPPYPIVADSNGVAVVTGLCPGIYTNIVAHFGFCTSGNLPPDTIGTVLLAVSSMDFTNPTKCGFCNGSIILNGITLSTVDTVSYTFNGNTYVAGAFNVTQGGTIVLGGLCDGTYTNIVLHSGFCTSIGYGPITLVNPALVITGVTTSDVSGCGVCDGIINLHGLPETQFDTVYYKYNNMWQPPVVFPVSFDNTINIVNLCVGEYDSLSVFTSGGCSTTAIGPYIVNGPGISAAFDYKIFYNCSGPDSVIFTNQSTPVNILARWHFGDGSVDTTYNPSHVYDTQGVYQVTLYTSNLPCIDSITQTIDTRHPISAGFTTSPSDTLCEGSTLAFNNTSTGGNPVYYWNFGDGSVIDSIDYNPPGHTYLHSGVYNVLLTERDSLNCIDTATATVYVDPVGDADITVSDTSICAGQSITFKANYTKTGSTSIQWNLGDGNIVNNQNPVLHSYEGSNLPQSLTVRLDVTNRICPDTGAFRTIHVLPYPAINLGPDTALCPTSSPILLGDLINSGNPLAKWQWNTGETTPNISVSQPGLYYSTVTLEGCSNSDSVLVRNDCYIEIPNVFTPNGDGVNDYFFPRQWLTSGVTNFHMSVYNRWGQQIFETTNSEGQGWDGRFNNVQQPEGVYIYMIEVSFKDGKHETHQGNVTILR